MGKEELLKIIVPVLVVGQDKHYLEIGTKTTFNEWKGDSIRANSA